MTALGRVALRGGAAPPATEHPGRVRACPPPPLLLFSLPLTLLYSPSRAGDRRGGHAREARQRHHRAAQRLHRQVRGATRDRLVLSV